MNSGKIELALNKFDRQTNDKIEKYIYPTDKQCMTPDFLNFKKQF